MDNIFEEEMKLFESATDRADKQLTQYIIECYEAYSIKSYITEKEHKSLYAHLKEFFSKIITALINFKNAIRNKLKVFASENTLEIRLRNARKELMVKKSQGEKYVESIDYKKYESTYLKMTDDLWKEAKKFAKIKYKNVSQIDRDLDVFNNKMKKYETQLDHIENKKVKVNIDDAINFLSKEIGQNSQVMKTIEDSEQRVKELEQAAMLLEEQRNILGSDIIPKHVSLIKRVTGSITSFIRRKVSKIIGVIVFLFAI